MFNRDSPHEARKAFYRRLSRIFHRPRPGFRPGKWQKGFAKYVAHLAFLWAVLILVLCPPVFVLNIIATEITMHTLPQAESNTHIGQWQPWASTVLVLIAALIARFHEDVKEIVWESVNVVFWCIGCIWVFVFERGSYDSENRGKRRRNCGLEPSRNLTTKPRMLDAKIGFFKRYKHNAKEVFVWIRRLIPWGFKEIYHKLSWDWDTFLKFMKEPEDKLEPYTRTPMPHPKWQRRPRKDRRSTYNPIAPGKNVDEGNHENESYRFSMGDPSALDEERDPVRLHPGYLPGSAGLKSLMKSIGLGDPSLENRPRDYEDVPYHHHRSEPAALPTQENPIQSIPLAVMADRRKHWSMAHVPPAPPMSSSSSQAEIRPPSIHNLPEMVTPQSREEDEDLPDAKSPTSIHEREMEMEQMQPAWHSPSRTRRHSVSAPTVSASINDSVARRDRR